MYTLMIDIGILVLLLLAIVHVSNPSGDYPEGVYEFFEEPVGRMITLVVI